MRNKEVVWYRRWWPRFEWGRCRIDTRCNYGITSGEGEGNPGRLVAQATKSCTVALNICGSLIQLLVLSRLSGRYDFKVTPRFMDNLYILGRRIVSADLKASWQSKNHAGRNSLSLHSFALVVALCRNRIAYLRKQL
jgi:hypothetical protein